MAKILVTSALPYANGPSHLGHIAGAYLPADLYTRYQRLRGRDVIHICGTDEHGVAITIRADQEGKSPKEIVDFYHEVIKHGFDALGIDFTHFSRTSIPLHHKVASDFFLRIYEKGYIVRKDLEQLYCPKCQRFLPDRYVVGTCPYCGYPGARGDQCEKCGRWLEPTQLVEPRCAICGTTPELRPTFHYYFRLSAFSDALRDWLASKTHWKDNVRRLALQWIEEGLRDRPITRDLEWGVKVPLPEAQGKVLYVWFDAPIGYISATIEWAQKIGQPDRWRDYWLDPETKLVHFIGKDNIVFHALIWPAMLMAHGDYVLPTEIPANEFLNLMGDKFSTSRNYAVWVEDMTSRFPRDVVRFGIAMILPETKDSDFDPREFQRMVNTELVNNFGNFVHRTLSFIERYMGGERPKLEAVDPEVQAQVDAAYHDVETFMESFEFRKALRRILALSDFGNTYFDRNEPWATRKTDPQKTQRTLAQCVYMVRALAVLMAPFLPDSAEKIRGFLGLPSLTWDLGQSPQDVGSDRLQNVEVLYRKITDEETEGLISLIRGRAQKTPEKEEEKPMTQEPIKPEISYEDFAKLDIRIGTIVAAEPVEGTDKLIKLTVDLGVKTVTLVAGIKEKYSAEDVVGKQVPVLANLKPRKIRGILSEGMILAANDPEGYPILLHPDKETPPGSRVT